jgi:hypothetical protein
MKNSEKKIAELAHQKFVERGGTHGYDITDWLAAEKELAAGKKPTAKVQKKTAKPAVKKPVVKVKK